jgi:hypothetical protein
LEERATLLASLTASTGRNYQVHRVYCYNIGGSSPASYTNSLILNNYIYMPFFGNSTYDDQALAAYQAAAPGYNVQGYYYGGWLSDDALHCRAKGVMDRGMLRVGHIPLLEEREGDVTVTAHVRAHSSENVTSVELHWRHGDESWRSNRMNSTAQDSFSAIIPAPTAATTTDYYIQATEQSGRREGMPRVAPAHWYSFPHLPGTVGVHDGTPLRPAVLHQNYPNPFNPQTTFSFELLNGGPVELIVMDARGRIVRRLVDGVRPDGINTIVWDGRDDGGRALPSGAYFYRLRAAGLQYTRSATLVK